MATKRPTGNIFGELGFPTLDKSTVIDARAREQSETFQKLMNEQAANVSPVERGVFTAFANAARMLSGKDAGYLTEEEKRQYKVMEDSNSKLAEMRNDPEFQKLSPFEQSMRSQEIIAGAAADNGDFSTYTTVMKKVAESRAAEAKRKLEMAKLETDTAKNQNELMASQEYVLTVPGGDAANYGGDFPGRVKLTRNSKGELVDSEGNVVNNAVSVDQWFKNAKAYKDRVAADQRTESQNRAKVLAAMQKNGGKIPGLDVAMKEFSFSEMQTAGHTAARTADLTNAVADVVEEAQRSGIDPKSVVGAAGKGSVFVTKVANVAQGFIGAWTGSSSKDAMVQIVDQNGQPTGETKPFKEWAKDQDMFSVDLDKDGNVKSGMFAGMNFGKGENASQLAEQYQSAMMDIFYASALALEPGSRALSDQDIKNQMTKLGGNSADPYSVMVALARNLEQGANDIDRQREAIRNTALNAEGATPETADRVMRMAFGLPPDGSADAAPGRKVIERLRNMSKPLKAGSTRGPQPARDPKADAKRPSAADTGEDVNAAVLAGLQAVLNARQTK